MPIKLTLSAAPLGPNTTPAAYSNWTHYVAESIEEATGLTIHLAKGGPETTENTAANATKDEQCAIYGWLHASMRGRLDGEEEVSTVLNEQGRDVVVATLKPGHLAWDEAAQNARAHRPLVPDAFAKPYYAAYAHFARLASERIRDSE